MTTLSDQIGILGVEFVATPAGEHAVERVGLSLSLALAVELDRADAFEDDLILFLGDHPLGPDTRQRSLVLGDVVVESRALHNDCLFAGLLRGGIIGLIGNAGGLAEAVEGVDQHDKPQQAEEQQPAEHTEGASGGLARHDSLLEGSGGGCEGGPGAPIAYARVPPFGKPQVPRITLKTVAIVLLAAAGRSLFMVASRGSHAVLSQRRAGDD